MQPSPQSPARRQSDLAKAVRGRRLPRPDHAPMQELPSALRRIADATLTLFAPPPTLTVSQWADRERRLSPEASAEPGQWDTSRAEYLRGVDSKEEDEEDFFDSDPELENLINVDF